MDDEPTNVTPIAGRKRKPKAEATPKKKKRPLTTAETNELLAAYRGSIEIDNLPIDDSGHAQRMFNLASETYGQSEIALVTREDTGRWIVFDHTTGMWSNQASRHRIDGWVVQVGNLLLSWAHTLRDHPEQVPDEDLPKLEVLIEKLLLQGAKLRSSGGMSAVRTAAAAIADHHLLPAAFDVDPDHVIVANGVLDLRDGTLHRHHPRFRLSRRISVAYDPAASAPVFHDFLANALPDPEVREWMQRSAGYWLTGHNSEQALWILHGPTGTGKSTLLDAIYNVMGRKMHDGYAMKAPRGLFRIDQSHWGDTATLVGARLVVDAEYAEQTVIDTSLIKMLTGEQDITANKKYGQHLMFNLSGKFVLMTNHLPSMKTKLGVNAADEAIFRRMFVVPMLNQMSAHAYKAGTYRQLPKALRAEAEGILAWMVLGAQAWYFERGLHVDLPATLVQASIDYRNSVGAFHPIWEPLKEAGYVLQPGLFSTTQELQDVIESFYRTLGRESNIPDIRLTARWLNEQPGLEKLQRQVEGERARGYTGIGKV